MRKESLDYLLIVTLVSFYIQFPWVGVTVYVAGLSTIHLLPNDACGVYYTSCVSFLIVQGLQPVLRHHVWKFLLHYYEFSFDTAMQEETGAKRK